MVKKKMEKYFDSDGVDIRYQVLGSGTPVILVHGYIADFESNGSSVIDVLTSHFQVIGIVLGRNKETDVSIIFSCGSFMAT